MWPWCRLQVVPATTKSSKFATSEASEAVCRTCSSSIGRPVGRLHAVCRSGGIAPSLFAVLSRELAGHWRAGRILRWKPDQPVRGHCAVRAERQRVRKQEEQGRKRLSHVG